MKGIFLADKSSKYFTQEVFYRVYSEYQIERILEMMDISLEIYDSQNLEQQGNFLHDVDYIFTGWGFEDLSEEIIKRHLPNLKALFYAGGNSAKRVVKNVLESGIRVFTAQTANAIPVAEYTLAHILLANKGVHEMNLLYKESGYHAARRHVFHYPCNYGSTVGILGVGRIGTELIKLLKHFNIEIIAYDPYLTPERAAELGIAKVSLEELFVRSNIITNHIADKPETTHLISEYYLSLLQDYSTIINTSGNIVDLDLLYKKLLSNTTLTYIWDTTDPVSHPIIGLRNTIVTPLIAGSLENEVERMGEYIVSECYSLIHGLPLKYELTLDMFDFM